MNFSSYKKHVLLRLKYVFFDKFVEFSILGKIISLELI